VSPARLSFAGKGAQRREQSALSDDYLPDRPSAFYHHVGSTQARRIERLNYTLGDATQPALDQLLHAIQDVMRRHHIGRCIQ
jgi:hypothetical protein